MLIRRSMLASIITAAGMLAMSCSERDPAPKPHAAAGDAPRLAVLSPALADTIRDLGSGSAIVGRHGWDALTPPSVPPVGSETGLDYESLLQVRPTAVVLQQGAKGTPPRLTELAAANQWLVATIPLLRLDDVRESITELAELTGTPVEITKELESRFTRAFAPDPALKLRLGRVLMLVGTDPPAAVGPGSFHHEILSRLGATPVPESGAAFQQLSIEAVMRLDPDSIVLLMPRGERELAQAGEKAVLGKLGEVGLRAAKDARVIVVTDRGCQLPSTGLVRTADAIRSAALAWPPLPAETQETTNPGAR